MAEEVLSLIAKVSLDDDNFKSGLKNIQSQAKNLANNVKDVFSGIGNSLKNIGSTMSSWGKTISVGITAPITALGVATAKTSVDFLKLKENTRTAFKVLLGSAEEAEKMLDDLYTFAKTTPFSYDTYLQAGKQLVAMGVSAKDAIPYLDGITNASIATGAGQEGINTLSEAIGRMSSKGKVQLEELNRMIEMGVPAVKILGNAYGVTEMEIYDMMKKGELLAEDTLPKLLDGMNNGTDGVNGMTSAYGGLASEMKGTLAGAIDSLKSKFRNMSVEMWNSEEAYPVLQEIIRSFTKTLEVLPKVFVGLTKAVVPVLTKVNEKLKAFGEYLDNADPKQLELIGKAILGLAVAGPVLIVVGKLTSALGGLFSTIGSIAGALPAIGSALGSVASVGFAPLLAIVGSVVGVFVFLREEWDKVVATFTGWIEKTGILQSFQNLRNGLQNVWEKLGGLRDLFYLIGGVITATLIPVVATVMVAFNGLVKALSGVMKMIGGVIDFLSGVGEVLLGIFTFDGEKILSGFSALWQGIKDIFSGAVEGIWNLVSGWFEGIWSFISSVLESIGLTQWLSDTYSGISQWLSNIWNDIFNTLNSVSGFISNIWNEILNFLTPILQSISSFFMTVWQEIKNTVIGALNNVWNSVSDIFINIWNFITNIFSNILSATTNMWNNIKNTVSNAINSIFNTVQSSFSNINNFISNIWNAVKNTTTSVWNSIKNAISQPIQNAFSTVKSWIDKIKGLFNFSWSLPKLKLPHFKVSGSFSLNPLSVPSFGIDWYKKGAVLNDPTIFGINPFSGNLMAGGEAGAEAIAPIDTLQDYVKQAVSENGNNNAIYSMTASIFEVLKEYLPNISKQKLVLDTGAIVGELSPYIDYNLGSINALKVRGN